MEVFSVGPNCQALATLKRTYKTNVHLVTVYPSDKPKYGTWAIYRSQTLDTVKIISVNIHTHTHKLLSGSSAPPVWLASNIAVLMWLTESRWTGWYAVCSEFAAKNTTLSTDSAEPCYQHFAIDSKESLTPAPRRVGILIRCCLTVTVSTVKWCVCVLSVQ